MLLSYTFPKIGIGFRIQCRIQDLCYNIKHLVTIRVPAVCQWCRLSNFCDMAFSASLCPKSSVHTQLCKIKCPKSSVLSQNATMPLTLHQLIAVISYLSLNFSIIIQKKILCMYMYIYNYFFSDQFQKVSMLNVLAIT